MRRTPIRIAGTCALVASLATSAAACGNADKKSACDKLQDTFSQVSQSGISQNNDPNGLARTYYNSATAMRQEGRDSGDSDVETAANDAASAVPRPEPPSRPPARPAGAAARFVSPPESR